MRAARFLAALLGVWALAGAANGQQYKFDALDSNGFAQSWGWGINNHGEVVGYTTDANGNNHAHKWDANLAGAELPYFTGSTISEAYRINEAGQVAGKAKTAAGNDHATYWTTAGAPAVTDIGVMGGVRSFAQNINQAGVVVGSSDAANGSHAFTWTPGGGFVDYGSFEPASNQNHAGFNGINDNGQMVGTAYRIFNPFKATMQTVGESTPTDISVPGQFSTSMAMAINNAGTIVGFSNNPSGSPQAAIFHGDRTITQLGTLDLSDSEAHDINEAGVIVGYAFGFDDATNEFISKAFMYENGQMIDLNSLLPVDSGWLLLEARGINDLGQVVGTGIYNGEVRGFVMSVVPEPASLSAIVTISAIAIRRRGR